MELELWSNKEDEYGFIVDVSNIKQRIYLENHTLIDGLDITEIEILDDIYKNELNESQTFNKKEILLKIASDWFNTIPYVNRYIELSDYIVFNHNSNKFELLSEKYSNSAERYIEFYTEDGKPIILGEFEFNIRRRLDLEDGFAVKVENYKEEHLYKIRKCKSYLFIKSDLNLGVKQGIIISKSAVKSLLNNNGLNII
ncbi:MAG: hypothetical protein AB7V48_00630 [Sedimentibacter sp.]